MVSQEKMQILFWGFMIFLFMMYIVSQFMVGFHDTIYEINIIVDDKMYNTSQYELPENSIPYLQYECIKNCIDNANTITENYCMDNICLKLGD